MKTIVQVYRTGLGGGMNCGVVYVSVICDM